MEENFYELALFAGAGGGLLGSKLLGWRTICYVEKEPYAIEVIKARIRDRMLDDAPIWDDVRTFDGHPWAGLVDIVTAGFPCQPWSLAGKRKGEDDDRNLWPDTIRIIREVRPKYVFLENVPGLLSRLYIQQIFGELAESGYDCRWDCIPAAAIGAPHIRDRLWIVAHTSSERRQQDTRSSFSDEKPNEGGTEEEDHQLTGDGQGGGKGDVPNTNSGGHQNLLAHAQRKQPQPGGDGEDVPDADEHKHESDSYEIGGEGPEILLPDTERERWNRRTCLQEAAEPDGWICLKGDCPWWATEPELGRVAHGVANRVDRLRAIGSGQVPGVVRAAWELLK
jgi:DNA (cytosine-5)-methyltransferase 1